MKRKCITFFKFESEEKTIVLHVFRFFVSTLYTITHITRENYFHYKFIFK